MFFYNSENKKVFIFSLSFFYLLLGVFGLIKRNRADVGLGGLFANPEINDYVSLTTIYSQPGITLLVPRPKMISNWHLPFRPFNIFTWKTLFLMLVFLTITIYLSNKILYHLEVSRKNQKSGMFKRYIFLIWKKNILLVTLIFEYIFIINVEYIFIPIIFDRRLMAISIWILYMRSVVNFQWYKI